MNVRLEKKKEEYENKTFTSAMHGDFTVLKYNSCNDVDVIFIKTKHCTNTNSAQIRKGVVKDVMSPVVLGVGFLGNGAHKPSVNNRATPAYKSWISMLQRCYEKRYLTNQPKNRHVKVCDEWLNFQNFSKWYDINHHNYTVEKYQLDKDLLGDGTMYSPDNCCYLPRIINKAIQRGQGVFASPHHNGKYRAISSKHSKIVSIHQSHDKEEVYQSYLAFKRGYILELINEYNDELSDKIKTALLGQFK